MFKGRNYDNVLFVDKKGVSVQTEYTIEWIENKRDWETLCSDKHPAPWELYEKVKTYDLQAAIEAFMTRYMNDKVFDVRMFEDTKIDDQTVREVCVDDFRYSDYLRNQEQRILSKENDRLKDAVVFAQERIDLFEKYLKQFSDGMKRFNEFCDKQEVE